MLKSYQFKPQCKDDIRISKTANIILPGLMTEYRWTPLGLHVQAKLYSNIFKCVDVDWNWDRIDTTRVTEFEYYTPKLSFPIDLLVAITTVYAVSCDTDFVKILGVLYVYI